MYIHTSYIRDPVRPIRIIIKYQQKAQRERVRRLRDTHSGRAECISRYENCFMRREGLFAPVLSKHSIEKTGSLIVQGPRAEKTKHRSLLISRRHLTWMGVSDDNR